MWPDLMDPLPRGHVPLVQAAVVSAGDQLEVVERPGHAGHLECQGSGSPSGEEGVTGDVGHSAQIGTVHYGGKFEEQTLK